MLLVAGLSAVVHAGFPSPAENLGAKRIELTARLVKPRLTRCAASRSDEAKDLGAKLSQAERYFVGFTSTEWRANFRPHVSNSRPETHDPHQLERLFTTFAHERQHCRMPRPITVAVYDFINLFTTLIVENNLNSRINSDKGLNRQRLATFHSHNVGNIRRTLFSPDGLYLLESLSGRQLDFGRQGTVENFNLLLARTSGFAGGLPPHSTVTLFAKFLGLSTSVPRAHAV